MNVASDDDRLLLIGDSFTEGLGYAYGDTFAGLIDQGLEDTEVLNAAVASYSPIIYWRKAKYLIEDVGLQFDRLAVYIDVSDAEDESRYYRLTEGDVVVDKDTPGEDGEAAPAKSFKQRVKDSASGNSILFVGVYKSYLRGLFPRADAAVSKPRSLWTVDPALYEEYGRDGLERSEIYMDKLHELLAARGTELTIAVYPWPDQLVQNDEESKKVAFWRELGRSPGRPVHKSFQDLLR